jgi:hypothetical protein
MTRAPLPSIVSNRKDDAKMPIRYTGRMGLRVLRVIVLLLPMRYVLDCVHFETTHKYLNLLPNYHAL